MGLFLIYFILNFLKRRDEKFKKRLRKDVEMLNPIKGRYLTNITRVENSKSTGVNEIVNRCEASATVSTASA